MLVETPPSVPIARLGPGESGRARVPRAPGLHRCSSCLLVPVLRCVPSRPPPRVSLGHHRGHPEE
uniref:Uncharacterized protein n=1 Tax=Arundo donax TaxID=35708 RepID=A0A0A9BKW9_ARUDO